MATSNDEMTSSGQGSAAQLGPVELMALGAAKIAHLVASKQLTAVGVTKASLARISEREPDVQAWEYLDAKGALRQAQDVDRHGRSGPLSGVPVGIKDIIDTRDMPTRLGSEICAERRPVRDAACVERLRNAGAVIVGKTVTTEFAYFTPGKTRNPLDLRRTPGGSSSGSAAAVADRMVPIAIATQAAGSTIRPASFCGIWAFKPSHGRWPNEGALLLYPTLDTLSVYGQCVDDLALVDSVLALAAPTSLRALDRPHIGLFVPPDTHWSFATPDCRQALESSASALRASGAMVEPMPVPDGYEAALAASEVVLGFEAAEAIKFIPDSERHRISSVMREMLELGTRITVPQYRAALEHRRAASLASDELLHKFDAVLSPGATGEAPEGLSSTGNPIFIRVWNFLHKPAANVPMSTGTSGMPVGVQMLAAKDRDIDLLSALRWIERTLSTPTVRQSL
jgi:Asp-tRNA(Asn)/Glu-tRNA(Gln) amidotransferase A subunit family amidase